MDYNARRWIEIGLSQKIYGQHDKWPNSGLMYEQHLDGSQYVHQMHIYGYFCLLRLSLRWQGKKCYYWIWTKWGIEENKSWDIIKKGKIREKGWKRK